MISTVPFYGQNWNVSNWSQLGFKDEKEAQYWKESSCGILCFKMAADALLEQMGKEKTAAIAMLIREGKDMGAYTHEKGWIHQGLVEMAKEYGLEAHTDGNIDAQKLHKLLDEGALVIASIKWAFETDHTLKQKIRTGRDFGAGPLKTIKLILNWKKFGGHLALVIGHDTKGFYVHHPSTANKYNWINRQVSEKQFFTGFTGRGIIFHPIL